MSEKQTNTWQKNMMGLTFRYADGRISIFKSALEAIGRPEFYHFLYNPAKQMFAIQACGIDEEGANRLPKHSTDDRYEIKSKGLVRLIYQSCGWDRTRFGNRQRRSRRKSRPARHPGPVGISRAGWRPSRRNPVRAFRWSSIPKTDTS